jgi:hypothetical protein
MVPAAISPPSRAGFLRMCDEIKKDRLARRVSSKRTQGTTGGTSRSYEKSESMNPSVFD